MHVGRMWGAVLNRMVYEHTTGSFISLSFSEMYFYCRTGHAAPCMPHAPATGALLYSQAPGAPRQVSGRLTGYVHNAVTVVGLATPALPVVLSHQVQALIGRRGGPEADWMWMGGGEPDLKLGMPVEAFMQAYRPLVYDCTYAEAQEAG